MDFQPPNGPPGGPNGGETTAAALRYLTGQRVCTLATVSPTGLPHAAMFSYVNEEMTFYVWTRPGTLTSRHLDANPAVSLTVGEYSPDWRETKGVQASGDGRVLLDPAEIRCAHELFEAKFPGLFPVPPMNVSFLRIRPTQVHFIDNERAAGAAATAAITFSRSLVYSVFGALPGQEAEMIAGRLGKVTLPAGETIVRQGGPADKFFIIVDGEVAVARAAGGHERVVATLGPGQFFGEVAILRDVPRTATVRAVTRTTLLTMDHETFRALVAQSLGTTQDFDEIVRARTSTLGRGAAGAAWET